MRKPRFPDVVKLKTPMTGFGLEDGEDEVRVSTDELGTIIEEYDRPEEAYLIEFIDDYGETTALVTATVDQFDVVYPLGRRVPEQVGV